MKLSTITNVDTRLRFIRGIVSVLRPFVVARTVRTIAFGGGCAVFVSNLAYFKGQVGPLRTGEVDKVTRYEQQLKDLLPYLPKTGDVGYLSDVLPTDINVSVQIVDEFYRAQYALVPLVLVPGSDREIVVAKFIDLNNTASLTVGLDLVKDFGGGLMLFRQRRP